MKGFQSGKIWQNYYYWFLKEQGVEREDALEYLKLLKKHFYELKEELLYNQRKRISP